MKIDMVSHWDIAGGASRAAYRIHHALLRHGIDSRMLVCNASAGDWTVQVPDGRWSKAISKIRYVCGATIARSLRTENPSIHSPAILPSRWPRRLNKSGADVVHLQWVNAETISIADIGKLRGPVVWTLHDMWGFCGAEHFTEEFRWREGYTRNNRPAYESGFDLNLWTWERKRKHWRRPVSIVVPSQWLADCVRQSSLLKDWPVSVVPNAIDTDVYQPIEKKLARRILNLPGEAQLLLFGAIGGTCDPRKGFDLLKSALDHLRGQMAGLELVVFGELAPRESVNLGFPIHYTGHLHDDISLSLLYSAADAILVPSRQESFSLCSAEAHACGTPVVAFDSSALPGIVEHEKNGYLAKPFDTEDLAKGIQWVLGDTERRRLLSTQSRQNAVTRFSYSVVAEQYLRAYNAALQMQAIG